MKGGFKTINGLEISSLSRPRCSKGVPVEITLTFRNLSLITEMKDLYDLYFIDWYSHRIKENICRGGTAYTGIIH